MNPPTHRFRSGAWTPVEDPPAPARRLRLLTLNTWFSAHEQPARVRAQLTLFADHEADIIALQEVTPEQLEWQRQDPLVQARYALATGERLAETGYGVVLLVAPPVIGFQALPLPSAQGRELLMVELDGDVRIGTVHLESMGHNAAARAEQLKRCQGHLGAAQTAVLMGDFNFCSTSPDRPALRGWADAWEVRRPQDPGWTVDSARNGLVELKDGQACKQRRYDQVILRDRSRRWAVRDASLVATEPIGPKLWPSDHFGVRVDLVWR